MTPSPSPAATSAAAFPVNGPSRIAGRWVAALGAAAIASLTLIPHPEAVNEVARTPWWCLVCGEYGTVDLLLNVLLFIPLGLGLRWSGLSRRGAQLIVTATTITIELLQWKFIAGRDASLSDVLTNSLGGALGIGLADTWPQLLLPAPWAARQILLVMAAAFVTVWGGTARALSPALPATRWFSQLAPEGVYLDDFRGTVVSVAVNGLALRSSDEIAQSGPLRQSMLEDGVTVTATAVTYGPTRFLASILSIFDEHQKEILVLGQDGRDLVFRPRLLSRSLRLHSPAIRLANLISEAPGDSVRTVGHLGDGWLSLRAQSGSRMASLDLRLSPSWGWTFLLPYEYALGREAYLGTALWVAGFLLPLGYWSVRSERSIANRLVPVVAAAIGLTVVPWLNGLPVAHWSEWVAAAVGIQAGVLLGRLSLRLVAPLPAGEGAHPRLG